MTKYLRSLTRREARISVIILDKNSVMNLGEWSGFWVRIEAVVDEER